MNIDKNDFNRVLLTELLPYEVPMLFSNDGYYQIFKDNTHEYFLKKVKDQMSFNYTIPFNFYIAKTNEEETRCLSIIHPIIQKEFIEFYKKYDTLLIYLCSKSPFSLRKIKNVATSVFFENLAIADIELEPSQKELDDSEEIKSFKSYFTYEPHDLIYKFYDKNDFQRLEQRFSFLWNFDISKCFYHIYTHSLTWAVKDKATAKKNVDPKATFENRFDKLMQKANYNETNGIVVGPEISRIFAEIIFQQIDLNVLKRVQDKKFILGTDFEIRRYVDDYFIYGNSQEILELIQNIYKSELSHYKLYFNENKTQKLISPFISNITIAKRELKKMVFSFFDSIIVRDDAIEKFKEIRNPDAWSKPFIMDFQGLVKSNNLTFDLLNKDAIRLFKRKLICILTDDNFEKKQSTFENFLLSFLDIIFYCYSLNINSSATFKVAQIIVIINKFLDGVAIDFKETIYSKIFRQAEFVMTNYHRKTKISDTNIETLNLMIVLKKLGTDYLISEKKIREYFNLSEVSEEEEKQLIKLNYFQILTLFYYFDNNIQYKHLKNALELAVLKKFECCNDVFMKAEFTCLFFDFICCPFIEAKSKRKLMTITKYAIKDQTGEVKKIEAKKMWFMNWSSEIDLEPILKKKEWALTY